MIAPETLRFAQGDKLQIQLYGLQFEYVRL